MSVVEVITGAATWHVETCDVNAGLAMLPERSIQCVVTSPPYWALRSYLPADHPDKPLELGSEKLHDCLGWATGEKCGECYICNLVNVFIPTIYQPFQ